MKSKDNLFRELGFSDDLLSFVKKSSFVDRSSSADKRIIYLNDFDSNNIDFTSSIIEKSETTIVKTIFNVK